MNKIKTLLSLFVLSAAILCNGQINESKTNTKELDFNSLGFGGSGTCNVNVNCSEGLNYQHIKRSVVRIFDINEEFKISGSGVLLNNTENNLKPLILTAYHVISNIEAKYFDYITFYFNYETPDCENLDNDLKISSQTIKGFKLLAYSPVENLDFALLELNQNIPPYYKPYYCGWDISEENPRSGLCIHHPSSDVKKISLTENIKDMNDEWHVYFRKTENGFGITEQGSSGSPLFNPEGNVIGTLKEGASSCNLTSGKDVYGKFSYNMGNYEDQSSSLRKWLDPNNTGITKLSGLENLTNSIYSSDTKLSRIYPNPCKEKLNVEFILTPVRIFITSANGIRVQDFRTELKENLTLQINTNTFSNGIYCLTIQYKSFRENHFFVVMK